MILVKRNIATVQFNQISISFYFFQSFFKKYFDRSPKYRSFSVYFICFLTELSFSKLVRSIKSLLLLSKKTIDFFYKIVIEKIVRSVKTYFLIFLKDPNRSSIDRFFNNKNFLRFLKRCPSLPIPRCIGSTLLKI